MMYHYQPTPLEQSIRQLYESIGVTSADQLDMIAIASRLNIWIYFENVRSQAIEKNGLYSVIIDRRLSAEAQWEEFGHEMCHLLRQAGNQLLLPPSVIGYQEAKAENFAYQFCIPTFMLLNMNLPEKLQEAVAFVCETFRVTAPFALRRLERFEKQRIGSEYSDRFSALLQAQDQFKRQNGIEYMMPTGNSMMMYCRERGVIGYMKGENHDEG